MYTLSSGVMKAFKNVYKKNITTVATEVKIEYETSFRLRRSRVRNCAISKQNTVLSSTIIERSQISETEKQDISK